MTAQLPIAASDTFTHRFPKQALTWSGICLAAALPSLLWAYRTFDLWAMFCGIAVYILAFAAITSTDGYVRFIAHPFFRQLVTGVFGLRVGVSVCYPIAMFVDVWPGLLSIQFIASLGLNPESFAGTFLVTLVQGALLNVILLTLMSGVFLIRRMRGPLPPPPRDPDRCVACGYDIRASHEFGRCPECGSVCDPLVEEHAVAARAADG